MAYWDFKELNRRTLADKLWRDKAFDFAKVPKEDGCHRGVDSMVYKFLIKKTCGSDIKHISNKELAEELQKKVIRKFHKRKVNSQLTKSGADLTDMQLISKFDKGFMLLLCVIVIYNKYVWCMVYFIKR